jgi:hypothetical protein
MWQGWCTARSIGIQSAATLRAAISLPRERTPLRVEGHESDNGMQYSSPTFLWKVNTHLSTSRVREEALMADNRKQAVSIRMSASDVRKIKKLAQRLGARDSDVIRFAVKNMLSRLAPLYDPEVRGRNLIPVFVESGPDLVRFFELDATRIEAIVNDGVADSRRVDRDDVFLIALMGAQLPYAALLLKDLNGSDPRPPESADMSIAVRQYLYNKYIYRQAQEACPASSAGAENLTGVLANEVA